MSARFTTNFLLGLSALGAIGLVVHETHLSRRSEIDILQVEARL